MQKNGLSDYCYNFISERKIRIRIASVFLVINSWKIEIHNPHRLDIIIGELVYRHSERNVVSDHADLFKVDRLFNCAHWRT